MITTFKRINSYQSDPMGWLGSAIMTGFAGYALWRWHSTGFIFFLLLVLRDLAVSWFLVTRAPTKNKSAGYMAEMLAYISSGWAFLYFASSHQTAETILVASCLTIAGFTLSTIALFDLGRSFGVSPANRGLVRTGVYRYLSHPMYVGYAVSEIGFVFLNPWNALLWIISVSLYFYRAKLEGKALSESIL